MKNKHFNTEIEEGGECYERTRNEEGAFEGANFALESVEEGEEGEEVEEHVEEAGVNEGVGI